MGSGTQKAAAVNLLCELKTHWRDTLSKKTTATSTIEITSTTPTLMLALELGEEKWQLGYSTPRVDGIPPRGQENRHSRTS